MHLITKEGTRLPAQVRLTVGWMHDVNKLTQLTYLKGMTYIFDRGYRAYDFLNQLIAQGAFFIVRLRSNTTLHVIKKIKRPSRRDYDDFTRLRDELVYVGGLIKQLSEPLRCVTFRTAEGTLISVLTNRRDLAAATLVLLYKNRWPIELFFSLDQVASEGEGLPGHLRECGIDSNLHGVDHLRVQLQIAILIQGRYPGITNFHRPPPGHGEGF